jgi:hypothetical protein
MMPWFRLTLVCWALLGLLLGLTPPANWNYQSHVVHSGPCFDQGKETASDSSTASVVERMECDPARAASLESLVLDHALTASNTGPPGQETHGASGTDGPLASCRSSRQLKPTPSSNLLHKITGFRPPN